MAKEKTSKEVFEMCETDTKFIFQEEIDIRKIKAMKKVLENKIEEYEKRHFDEE